MAGKGKEIKVGILGDPGSFKVANAVKSNGSKEYYQGMPSEDDSEKRSKPGRLINRQNHPVTLSYNGEALVIPPKGLVVIANSDKLGGLAAGVVLVPDASLKN